MNTISNSLPDSQKSSPNPVVGNDTGFLRRLFIHSTEWTKDSDTLAKVTVASAVLGLLVFILLYIQILAPSILENSFLFISRQKTSIPALDTLQISSLKKEYIKKTEAMEVKMNQISKLPYIVINSTKNEFKLYSGGNLVREGVCSTGSYVKLEYDDKQHWVFRTPKGMLKIKNKTKSPVWKKPDWAFIEEGKPVPSPNHPSRFEYGVLGDYSLALGDGYLIHGTLYQRLLGMPVTHGCVRLGDDDLEAVFRTLRIGDRVFIY